MKSRRFLRSLPLIICALAMTKASAQTVISSVPFTIGASGKYVLGGNLNTTTTVTAITVNASNVILDLNGFYVSGPGNTPAATNAVIQVNDVSNVTIRNGTVANGAYGIRFTGTTNSLNYQIESVNFTRCYYIGVLVLSSAPGSVVRRCNFSQIGGTSFDTDHPTAIYVVGDGVRIENNAISTVTASADGMSGYGIRTTGADLAVGNTIYDAAVGIMMTAQGKFLDNLTSRCTTPFSGGVNATGNN